MQLEQRVALPFCAFNGGSDVFVDIGNKSLGLDALLQHLAFQPQQVAAPTPPPPPTADYASAPISGFLTVYPTLCSVQRYA